MVQINGEPAVVIAHSMGKERERERKERMRRIRERKRRKGTKRLICLFSRK
jgi:hypothetical protein